MEPQRQESTLFTEDVKGIIKMVGQLPTTQTQLLGNYEKYINTINQNPEIDLLQNIQEVNTKAIEQKFMSMMTDVYREIQPHLKFYNKHGAINYLDQKICSRLDKKIYPNSYRLHKYKETPMGNLIEKDNNSLTDKMFGQLFDIVHQLLSTFKTYYQVQNNGKIEEVIFESLSNFMEENQNSYLVQEDRKSLLLQNERRSMIKEQSLINKDRAYDEMAKIASNLSKDNGNKGIIDSTIGAVYKYAVSSGAGFLSSNIKKLNPFSYLKEEISQEEKQKIKYQIINHLNPHLSVKEELDEVLVSSIMKFLPLKPEKILQSMQKNDKEKFGTVIGDLLSQYETYSETFSQIVQQMMTICDESSKQSKEGSQIKSQSCEVRWLILLYKVFQRNYNPERRRVLFRFCNLSCIKDKIQNPIGILKFIESQEIVSTQFVNLLRTLPLKQKDEKKKFQLSKKKTDLISQALEHELHRIHLYELQKKFKEYPLLQFERLTICPPKKVITIVFSGFMSQDSCKVQEWDPLLETVYDSQVFSVRWESKTFGDMFDFAVDAGKNIVQANMKIGFLGAIGGPYLRALAIIRQIYKKYQQNPFNPAFESAIKTGKFLAELIISSFKGHFVNLVGFSLGTELIKNILQGLAVKRQLGMVNKVYLMGGCADKNELEHIIENSTSSLSVANLYSDRDAILKYLLKICKPGIVPIGLNPIRQIQGHDIRNLDCSDFINGHLAYRQRLDILSRLLNMKDD